MIVFKRDQISLIFFVDSGGDIDVANCKPDVPDQSEEKKKRKFAVMEIEDEPRPSPNINEKRVEKLEIERKFPYFGRLSIDYESARERFSMPTKEEIRAARGKDGESNVALYKYWLDDDTMNAIVQKEVEEMDEKDKDRFYVFPISVWVSIKSTSEAEHPKHPADRYQLTKSAIWPNSNFKKLLEGQRKFNPFERKYLLLPIIHDAHWNLAVIVNPMAAILRLAQKDPPTEKFIRGKEDPFFVEKIYAKMFNLSENERMDASKVTQEAPSLDEPVIYIFCSNKKNTWIRNCELACEFLTGMFLDESNPALKNLQQDFLKKHLLVRKTVKMKDTEGKILAVKKMLSIVNGRKPRTLVCPPTESGKPCPLCFNNGKNHHEKFLPFRYYKPSTPTQSNDFDCGTYTLYAIRMWMQQESLVTSSLHQDSTRLWTPVDIYKYRYECRRYLDRIAGRPDREPVNEFGTAEENCYLPCQKKSYDLFRMVGDNVDLLKALEKIGNSTIDDGSEEKESKDENGLEKKESNAEDTAVDEIKALSVGEVGESLANEETEKVKERKAESLETCSIQEASEKEDLPAENTVEENNNQDRHAAEAEDSTNDAAKFKTINCIDREKEQNEIISGYRNVQEDKSTDSISTEADNSEEIEFHNKISDNEDADDSFPIYSPEDISSRFVQLMIDDEPEDIESDSSMIAEVKGVFNEALMEEKQLAKRVDPEQKNSPEGKLVRIEEFLSELNEEAVVENSEVEPVNYNEMPNLEALQNCNQAVIDEKIGSLDESCVQEEGISIDASDFSDNSASVDSRTVFNPATIVRKTWAFDVEIDSSIDSSKDSSMEESNASREDSKTEDISKEDAKKSPEEEVESENEVKEEEKENAENMEECTNQEPSTTNDSPEDNVKEKKPPANEDTDDAISASELQSSAKNTLNETIQVVEVIIQDATAACKKDEQVIIIDDSLEEESTDKQERTELVESVLSRDCPKDFTETKRVCGTDAESDNEVIDLTTEEMPVLVPSLKRQAKLKEIKEERMRCERDYSLHLDNLYEKERKEFQERELKLHAPHPNNVRRWLPRRTRMNEVRYSDKQTRKAPKRPRPKAPVKKVVAAKEPENEVVVPLMLPPSNILKKDPRANEPPKKKKKKSLEKKTTGIKPLPKIFEGKELSMFDCEIQTGGMRFQCKASEGLPPTTTKEKSNDEDQIPRRCQRRVPQVEATPATSSLPSSADSPGRRKKKQMLAEAVKKKKVCGECDRCQRLDDCGQCDFCLDKPKFGGPNKRKRKCRLRTCISVGRGKNSRTKSPRSQGCFDEYQNFKSCFTEEGLVLQHFACENRQACN
ncbi:Oidioi.mRNA.OKI2018_I69.chr2.g5864.t1.cds [Oikopleura dioica]|uniref:Oidioi.mRNA.OKI2018_I69.chr2.g5864.t1.cds n=1 Tax=Oikopleura dioica TaxID=34765 RepID=A0ABN7T4U6_OIKDI|nr:Oidioi.mRNA.OKI2018_I69.chr2.g5864.t1.cds [Oikopleura dioica]